MRLVVEIVTIRANMQMDITTDKKDDLINMIQEVGFNGTFAPPVRQALKKYFGEDHIEDVKFDILPDQIYREGVDVEDEIFEYEDLQDE